VKSDVVGTLLRRHYASAREQSRCLVGENITVGLCDGRGGARIDVSRCLADGRVRFPAPQMLGIFVTR